MGAIEFLNQKKPEYSTPMGNSGHEVVVGHLIRRPVSLPVDLLVHHHHQQQCSDGKLRRELRRNLGMRSCW